jgi:hypothetical protein
MASLSSSSIVGSGPYSISMTRGWDKTTFQILMRISGSISGKRVNFAKGSPGGRVRVFCEKALCGTGTPHGTMTLTGLIRGVGDEVCIFVTAQESKWGRTNLLSALRLKAENGKMYGVIRFIVFAYVNQCLSFCAMACAATYCVVIIWH